MLTNILLGLILIALIIITCGKNKLEEKILEANQKKVLEENKEFNEQWEKYRQIRMSTEYTIPDCKEEIITDCLSKEAGHNPIVKEKIHRMAGLPMREDYPISVVREQPKPKKKVNKEYERKIADGFFEDLVVKILKEKREKMCSTVDILKRHRTTMNTFKRHATKEQIAELMALQVETKKQSVNKQRQNIYHKRS